MEEKKKLKAQKSKLEIWEQMGIPCYYVRFHQPIPAQVNSEPVSEFTITSSTKKYLVDSIVYTEHGVIWRAGKEVDICALANVMYARSVKS